jgi:uncharacterized membrane protein YdcZ (DUF606 family)
MLVVNGGNAGGPLGEVLVLSGMTAAMPVGFLTMAALIICGDFVAGAKYLVRSRR